MIEWAACRRLMRTLFNWASLPLPASYTCSATNSCRHTGRDTVQGPARRPARDWRRRFAAGLARLLADLQTGHKPRTSRSASRPVSSGAVQRGQKLGHCQIPSSRRARISFHVSLWSTSRRRRTGGGRTLLSLGGTFRRSSGTPGGRLLSCLCHFRGRRDIRCVGRGGILRPGTVSPPDCRFGLALGRRGKGSGFQKSARWAGRRVRSFYRTAGVGSVGSRLRTLDA